MSDRTATASKRRSQAILGGLAGALVFVVLIVVFAVVRSDGDDNKSTPANAAAPVPLQTSADPLTTEPEVQPGTGGPLTELVITPLVKGTGPVVKAGQTVTFNYKLIPYKGGAVIDSSWSRKQPFTSQIGAGKLIAGWDQGIPGQSVGSRIQMDVPAALAYKDQDLRFVVDILDAQ